MFSKLATVTLVALFSLSPPYEQDTAALKREIEALKAQQAEMQKDLDAIRAFLQQMIVEKTQAAMVNAPITVAGEPAKGSTAAKVMMVEVSDYHCPFCRRHTLTTQPQIDAEYINTGKLRYVFIDYPIDQLHPEAFRAHEAANCAGEQGNPGRCTSSCSSSRLARQHAAGPDARVAGAGHRARRGQVPQLPRQWEACDTGQGQRRAHAGVGRRQHTDVSHRDDAGSGQPMKVLKVVRGAVPFAQFKAAIDEVLNQ